MAPDHTSARGPSDAELVIDYPPNLPVSLRRDDIAALIAEHQVLILAGETGSGKTTQLPKILLELGYQSIGHTQPRRIAARTIAERISEELGQELGGLVGYRVRFTDRVGKDTRIKLMTDGILLAEIHRDRLLKKYDAIIIDEAHERSLTIDFLLGYLKQLLPQRPELKVIITSATIDPESFSRHFGGAPILEVSGRTYPVEIRYRPLVAESWSSSPQGVSRPGHQGFDTEPKAPTQPTRGEPKTPTPTRGEPKAPTPTRGEPKAPTPTRGEPKTPTPTRGEDFDTEPEAPPQPTDFLDGINAALDELAREGDGDVLVFLSGETEIKDAEESIRGRIATGALQAGTEVLPLYGRLSAADQHKVFQPSTAAGTRRRIVLATNVAETSLTVPGIRYVIDAGTARISRYSVRSKIQRLPIEAISQASANQRSGRSGRTSAGIAIRLYSEEDYTRRPEFTEPEILRTNLAAVILQMISLGLGDIERFPFLQPPDARGIKDGLDLLRELGAVSPGATAITPIGRQLAQLPIDPRLARMVVESKRHGTTREVIAIVAGLSIQDPRERPLDRRQQADTLHARFTDPTSDFLTLLNLWNHLEQKQGELSGNQFRKLCRTEHLNYLRVREWQDLVRQLQRAARALELTVGQPGINPDGIHKSLLAGLLSHLGIRDEQKKDYVGARQIRFSIFPGSALAKKQPAALMSAELVETSRLFARMNAAIDPAWAEPIAGDLCKRSYGEPHWEKKQGAVIATERVTLFGVPIVPRRSVQFSRIDPAYARELFIRHALVAGEWDSRQAFDRANRKLRRELADLEERTRRRDILYDDEAVYEFYHRRLPPDVTSQRSFEGWWRKARVETPDLLTMTAQDLLDEEETAALAEPIEQTHPTHWRQGDQRLAVSYRFEPGAADDGVTVAVPLPLLPRLSAAGFDWQVAGLREELVTALIKSLPKTIRRHVVPAADWARRLLAELPVPPSALAGAQTLAPSLASAQEATQTATPTLTAALAAAITRHTQIPVDPADFDLDRVPAHLRITFAVVDERSRTVASGKDLAELQQRLKARVRDSVAAASATTHSDLERAGLTRWDFDELPRTVDTRHGGNTIRAYPALVDEGSSVAIRLMSTPEDQARMMRLGLRRLLLLAVPAPSSYVQEHLSTAEKLALTQSPYRSTAALFEDCMAACVDAVLGEQTTGGMVFSRGEFEAVRDAVSAGILDALFQTVSLLAATITAGRETDKAITAATSMGLLGPLADARAQLDALVFPGFVATTGLSRLPRLPVYLRGITHRVGKLSENPGRDRVWMTEVHTAIERYKAAGGTLPAATDTPDRLVQARWMLEELRLSLFAQPLGAAGPVSLQRITKLLQTA